MSTDLLLRGRQLPPNTGQLLYQLQGVQICASESRKETAVFSASFPRGKAATSTFLPHNFRTPVARRPTWVLLAEGGLVVPQEAEIGAEGPLRALGRAHGPTPARLRRASNAAAPARNTNSQHRGETRSSPPLRPQPHPAAPEQPPRSVSEAHSPAQQRQRRRHAAARPPPRGTTGWRRPHRPAASTRGEGPPRAAPRWPRGAGAALRSERRSASRKERAVRKRRQLASARTESSERSFHSNAKHSIRLQSEVNSAIFRACFRVGWYSADVTPARQLLMRTQLKAYTRAGRRTLPAEPQLPRESCHPAFITVKYASIIWACLFWQLPRVTSSFSCKVQKKTNPVSTADVCEQSTIGKELFFHLFNQTSLSNTTGFIQSVAIQAIING